MIQRDIDPCPECIHEGRFEGDGSNTSSINWHDAIALVRRLYPRANPKPVRCKLRPAAIKEPA